MHTWSLAVAKQYYVFFPVFLLLIWRFGKRLRVLVLACLALASVGMAQLLVSSNPSATFYLLPTRGWELLIGGFIALGFSKQERPVCSLVSSELLSISGLLLILFATFAFDRHTTFPSIYALVPTAGAALIIVFTGPTPHWTSDLPRLVVQTI